MAENHGEQTVTETVPSSTLIESEPMLKWFAYGHLPPHLQVNSKPFADLAIAIVATVPRSAERTVGLRKLLEAKDCIVRAVL